MTGKKRSTESYMTGAMYSAINGLKAHMTKLNVIGNNVANVNTNGYKAQRMVFQESLYTTSRSGSNGVVDQSGGITPSQIGYGATVGSIDLNMASATYAPTGYQMDAFIDGEGFYMVGTPDLEIRTSDDFSKLNLTRVGDFNVDPNGYVVDGYGNVVYGFATVQNPDYNPNASDDEKEEARERGIDILNPTVVSTELVPLRLPLSAVAPTEAAAAGGTGGTANGNGGIITVNGEKVSLWDEGQAVYPILAPTPEADATGDTSRTNIDVTTLFNAAANGLEDTNLPEETTYTLPGATGGGGAGGNTRPENVIPIPNSQDKCVALESMQVGADGCILGINKMTKQTVVVGYIAIATPECSEGLTHLGGPYYSALAGSGDVRVSVFKGVLEGKYINNKLAAENVNDAIMAGGNGEIRNGGLEASSTDVATEFSEMITTQRGYQANTRIITVTDSMLEELVNMKR